MDLTFELLAVTHMATGWLLLWMSVSPLDLYMAFPAVMRTTTVASIAYMALSVFALYPDSSHLLGSFSFVPTVLSGHINLEVHLISLLYILFFFLSTFWIRLPAVCL